MVAALDAARLVHEAERHASAACMGAEAKEMERLLERQVELIVASSVIYQVYMYKL